MTRLILALYLIGTATAAFGETFECRDPTLSSNSPVIVVATVNDDRESGEIGVAGVRYETAYWVAGFNRHWAWGIDDEEPQFFFTIQPDGTGKYFVGQPYLPSQEFKCRER